MDIAFNLISSFNVHAKSFRTFLNHKKMITEEQVLPAMFYLPTVIFVFL